MAAVSEQKMSDEKVKAATGRVLAEWCELLDAQGATTWKHQDTARWLVEEHGVDGWWAQAVTIGYEQERGQRVPGQRADGSFAVSATKTISAARADVIDAVLVALVGHFGEPTSRRPASPYSTARWKIDGHTITAGISEVKPGKTLIALERSKLSSVDSLDSAKAELRRVLDSVAHAAL